MVTRYRQCAREARGMFLILTVIVNHLFQTSQHGETKGSGVLGDVYYNINVLFVPRRRSIMNRFVRGWYFVNITKTYMLFVITHLHTILVWVGRDFVSASSNHYDKSNTVFMFSRWVIVKFWDILFVRMICVHTVLTLIRTSKQG